MRRYPGKVRRGVPSRGRDRDRPGTVVTDMRSRVMALVAQRAGVLLLISVILVACSRDSTGTTASTRPSSPPQPGTVFSTREDCEVLVDARAELMVVLKGYRSLTDALPNLGVGGLRSMLESAEGYWANPGKKFTDRRAAKLARLESLFAQIESGTNSAVEPAVALIDELCPSEEVSGQGGGATHSRSPEASPQAPPAPSFDDGTWIVSEDIKAGTYRAASPGADCYWQRLRNFSGGLNSILANGLAIGGPIVVEVKRTDEGFSSDGCGPWSGDLSRVSTSKSRIGDGIWIMGTDAAPGTYRTNVPGGNCYWARLRDFSGGLNSIIANDLPGRGSAIVELRSTDAGFETHDCGTWERV